jgi:formate hydrogenlyase transcriptional activator
MENFYQRTRGNDTPAISIFPTIDSKSDKMLSNLVEEHLRGVKGVSQKFYEAVNAYYANPNEYAGVMEESFFYNVSKNIASAKNKSELSAIISENLQTLFSISGYTVVLKNLEGTGYSTYLFGADEKISADRDFEKLALQNPEGNEQPLLQMLTFNEPAILELEELADFYDKPGLVRFWLDHGVRKVIGTALRAGHNELGCLFFYLTPNAFDKVQTDLLTGFSAHISVAISNMVSAEKIGDLEGNRELLLSLNTDISRVANNEELLQVIKLRLKTLLGFSHTLIATINEDKVTAYAFLLDPEAKANKHPSYNDARSKNYVVRDGIMDKARESAQPVVFNLETLNKSQDIPLYAKINYESGLKQLVVTRFAQKEEVFGFWMLYFEENLPIRNDKLKLIQSLSNQISIAVANIIAAQEIKSREEEKSRLLKFSTAIASVRDKVVLSEILKIQLEELFSIKSYIIHALSEDKNSHMPLLYDTEADYSVHPDFSKLLNTWTDVNDGVFDLILANEGPVFFDLRSWHDLNEPPTYANVAKDLEISSMIGIAIRLGEENIAVMNFIHEDFAQIQSQEYLLKSICSQIAVAVSNVIANEKVNIQLSEINDYKQRLEEESVYLKEEIQTTQNYSEIIGEGIAMQKVFRMVSQVAPSDSTVLILGETGTGKELIARAIHNNSPRRNKLMVKVNCAALPANLIESELFGHERGSFTGATERRLGKFELANNGTLFLDEIGEMPLELQVKLLRALQEREIERIGGKGTIKIDVRIIAATNRDLEKEIEEGRFRCDLFYRLNIFPIYLCSLKERKEDIPLLATHFIHRYSKKVGRNITSLSSKALQEMMQYHWPGNIREMEHLIERSVLLSTGDTLKQIHLPSGKALAQPNGNNPAEILLRTIDENECDHILKILKYCHGRISGSGGAAEILGVPPSTLNSKIKRLGIKKEHLV